MAAGIHGMRCSALRLLPSRCLSPATVVCIRRLAISPFQHSNKTDNALWKCGAAAAECHDDLNGDGAGRVYCG